MTMVRNVIVLNWITEWWTRIVSPAMPNVNPKLAAGAVLGMLRDAPEPVRLELAALFNPWRPIETAPKGDSDILGCFKGQFGWMMFRCRAMGKDSSAPGYTAPTHWLPLL